MRHLMVMLLCSTSFLLLPSSLMAADRLAHVNSVAVASLLPEYAEATKELELFAGKLQSQLKSIQGEFHKKNKEFSENEKQLTITDRALLIGELEELQSRMEQFSATAEQSYQLKENELLRPVIDKTKILIGEVAKENGITYVFDNSQSNILYYDPARDLLPLVKKKLGLR